MVFPSPPTLSSYGRSEKETTSMVCSNLIATMLRIITIIPRKNVAHISPNLRPVTKPKDEEASTIVCQSAQQDATEQPNTWAQKRGALSEFFGLLLQGWP
jgi:hypothetical protein